MRVLTRRRFLGSAATASAALMASARGATAPTKGREAMEAALEILAATGPEYHGGLANHGPMAAEALVTLGRPEAVVPWVEGYRRRLDARPSGTRPIVPEAWKEALGARGRVGDWLVFFRRRAEEKPWRELLGEWVPRFAPGVVAAAFHGAIRTAHAARSLAAAETPARLRELADGLAYWAANYHELPASTGAAPAGRLPSQAITRVAHLPAESAVNAGFILDRLAPVERFAPFANVAEAVDATGDASAFLSDLTETFAGVFLASVPPGGLITFVHAVTGPSAVRLLLPHLSAPARASILRFAWQGAAAFYCGFGGVPPAPGSTSPPLDRELVDRAIATRDEHAIKFTEACLREHAIRPSPVFLRAAHHAVEQFG